MNEIRSILSSRRERKQCKVCRHYFHSKLQFCSNFLAGCIHEKDVAFMFKDTLCVIADKKHIHLIIKRIRMYLLVMIFYKVDSILDLCLKCLKCHILNQIDISMKIQMLDTKYCFNKVSLSKIAPSLSE